MGRITNYDKKVWNTYKQALTPKLSVTKGTGVASVSVSDGLKSFANGDLITIGNTYTVTATPSPGYAHSALLINGVVKTNPATVVITDNQFSVVAQASDILFDLAVVGNHMTLAVVDGEIEYSAGANVLPLGAEVVITATNDVGYEVTGITINGEPFNNGDTLVVSTNTEIEVFVAELSHDLTITKDANCTVTVMYGEDELVAGEDIIPNSAELVITATADSGYSIASLTVNGTAFTSGESIVATDDIAIVATAVAIPLVGEIDFNTDSTWDSENEMYVVDAPPTLDFSGLTDGDVNIKITYTIDGNTTTAIGTKGSAEPGVLYISSLFSPSGTIDLGGGLDIAVYEGIGENPDTIFLLAPENYLLTHTVVLNSIKIDENITEILSADIDYAYDSIDKYNGTITAQTIDTTGLINEQSNIKTYWQIDDTMYIVNAMAIISGTTTSFQQSIVTDTLTITTGVLAKIIDTDGVITTEITGLTGTEVVTLLSVFVDENV